MSFALAEINNEQKKDFSKISNNFKDDTQLKVENERLKTTVYLLNQKLKIQEDDYDMEIKWKKQLQSKDSQIQILND